VKLPVLYTVPNSAPNASEHWRIMETEEIAKMQENPAVAHNHA